MTEFQVGVDARLLLVDDDVVVLRALSSALAGFGNVRFATRAEDALKLLEQEPVDLLMIDAELPGMSGLAFLETVARRPNPRPRTMLVTSHRQPAIEASARLLGAVGVLHKPFTPQSVAASVAAALNTTQATDAPHDLESLVTEPFRMLVIADDVEVGHVELESIAALCGWIEYAGSAELALKRAWAQSIDAIVVMSNLRHADPIQVILAVRGEPSLLSTPIVLIQDDEGRPDELLALQAGVTDIVRPGSALPIIRARLVNLMRAKRYAEFALAAMRP